MRNLVLPAATFVAFIAAWHGYVTAFDVPDFILPHPSEVAGAFIATFARGTIWPHLLFTVQCLAAGYVMGCAAAVALGTLVAESRTVEGCLYPYVIALQSMPKVALAPLLFVWFGFGAESKIVMVALICFFPVFVNTMVGIKQADPALIDVMRASAATRWQIFIHVKLPAAASSIFAGLQIAVVLGLIGALVAEFISTR
ncbi:MAG: ABC transporter permease, partial [Alphaproteobacteria bacterium]